MKSKAKKSTRKQQPHRVTIHGCNFTSQPEPIESVRLRAEAIKAAADALGKIADALNGDQRSAPLLEIKQTD